MPSTSDSRQPYRLSNLLFVTESFTLMARNQRALGRHFLTAVTPVVVSSVTPMIWAPLRLYQVGSTASLARMDANRMRSSSLWPSPATSDASFSAPLQV